MAKDKIGYRVAKRFSHGEQNNESAIGMTSLFSADVAAVSHINSSLTREERLEKRPNALIKWSFDDFCAEEVLPNTITAPSFSESACSCLLTVISEGVPVSTLQNVIKNLLPNHVRFHFLSPIDFVSCNKRFIWIREKKSAVEDKILNNKQVRSKDGIIFFTEIAEIPVSPQQTHFPIEFLPDVMYTILLRNVSGCLADVLEPLRDVCRKGFLNYSHSARQGMGLLHSFDDAKLLLHREYRSFLKHYVQSLSEGTFHVKREISSLSDLLDENTTHFYEWNSVRNSVAKAIALDHPVVARHNTGLYHPHHKILNGFVSRAADLFPKHNDAAVVLRESISGLVLREKMRSIADVAFNMMTSARWNLFGSRVVVGDLVVNEKQWGGDAYEACSDRLSDWTTSGVERDWISIAVREGKFRRPVVKVIRSTEEAQAYSIKDVVVPLYGRNFDTIQLPANGTEQVFHHFVSDLEVQGFPQMSSSPESSYRHLVRSLISSSFYVVDEDRGWDWVEDEGAQLLKDELYKDQEGIVRIKSPLHTCLPRNVIARPGIRTPDERKDFLKPAQKKGMTCVLRATVPRGTPVTSVLREVFRFSTLSAAGVCRILR